MAIPLRQSTASQEIPLGVFVDSVDGNTAETGLTIANTDIKLWKMGATSLANKNSGGATHMAGGVFYTVLDATDTNTLGGLVVFVQVAGALAVRVECVVLAANVYDALVAGSDKLQVHTDEITANLVNAAALATDAVTEMQNGLATAAALATVAGYIDTEVAAIYALLDTEIAAILAKVTNLPASPAAVGSAMTLAANSVNAAAVAADAVAEIQSGLSVLTAADVNAQVVDVLTVDTFAEPSGVPAATSSLKDKINWLFMLARNKRITSGTTDKVRNDADSADVGTAALSDDGTNFTRGEYV